MSDSTSATISIGWGETRVESREPNAYRLARRAKGELILQGRFDWQSAARAGSEWRDLPTIDLDEAGSPPGSA